MKENSAVEAEGQLCFIYFYLDVKNYLYAVLGKIDLRAPRYHPLIKMRTNLFYVFARVVTLFRTCLHANIVYFGSGGHSKVIIDIIEKPGKQGTEGHGDRSIVPLQTIETTAHISAAQKSAQVGYYHYTA
ncbi:hypothetical protein ACFVAD_01510 [Sutcliffiella sp. NPDC057660]|uniref:hypothetical protein n=1 Tax=Sutcliffiella sp. NPDC057660 TaxID=3346199 RepID=UPI0036C36E4E